MSKRTMGVTQRSRHQPKNYRSRSSPQMPLSRSAVHGISARDGGAVAVTQVLLRPRKRISIGGLACPEVMMRIFGSAISAES